MLTQLLRLRVKGPQQLLLLLLLLMSERPKVTRCSGCAEFLVEFACVWHLGWNRLPAVHAHAAGGQQRHMCELAYAVGQESIAVGR